MRKASGRERYDLVFIDPPYSMAACGEAARLLVKEELIIPGAIVVLESGDEEIDVESLEKWGYEVIKSERYGKKTAVNILLYRGERE
jgi:16S rRNA G966 N2-methylase RsmD